MNKVTEASFYRTYFAFGGLFLSITLAVAAFILFNSDIQREQLILAIFIYVFFILSLTISFILLLKKKITSVIKAIDGIIDNAINRENSTCISYEETSLSALENKMYRFVSMSKATTAAIDEERNKIKSLISDISHQTKTPIANILLYSELLLDRSTINQEERELAEGIRVQSEKFKWLIESLVKMSRLEVGIISANKALLPVFQTISRSIGAVFSEAEKKNIQIHVSCREDIKACHDSKWSSEAITNILENGIKYTATAGRIDVTVKQYEIFTEIAISDTGIGIREDEITSIFKRFYRSKDVSQYEGVGIGLYLSREIIASQGGYIKVKSQISKGSVFSVFLPNT